MSDIELLKTKVRKGLIELGKGKDRKYIERAKYELSVIEKLNFTPYFLVMWDIARFARENDLVYGPGRGSGAGSLVNYSLKITLIDPLKYGLIFERFLNPERVSPPDIDWDVVNREKIISYLEEKYGKDRVARVGSINFLRTKSAIRDVGRVLEKKHSFVEELTKIVPPPVAGLWASFEKECEVVPELLNPMYSEVMEPVEKLWGVVRSYGTHAGGVAIAPGPINEFVPLYKDKEGNAVSQFDWRDLEASGLLKFDILGLSTLEVIDRTLKHVENTGVRIKLEDIEDGDPKTYELICSGDLDGVFQLGGSESIKQLTVSFGPKSIEDIAKITSLFRPGPLSAGLAEIALKVKNGTEEAIYDHPVLEDILKETYSVPIFQEQLMKICTDLCGYTPAEADFMRKILGKKLKDKMVKEGPKFKAGAIKNGMEKRKANKLWKNLEKYAEYLFNSAHAVSYSVITYWTAYLKAHYPVEYYAALLSCEKKPDMISQYSSSIKSAGIEILPPDINLSGMYHKPEGKAIRFGLANIKGMQKDVAAAIIAITGQ